MALRLAAHAHRMRQDSTRAEASQLDFDVVEYWSK